MSMTLYGWLVPIGALIVAAVGVLYIHVITARLEARFRREQECEAREARPAE